jgi:DNA-binding Lrp family transcriptional regulator
VLARLFKILREVRRDARASLKTVAQKVGVSEATVFVRVRKMQKKGVYGTEAIIVLRAVKEETAARI